MDLENRTIELTPFRGLVWRIVFANQQHQVCESVLSPVGRFHHSGQIALYTSCTEQGASVAIKRYVKSDDPVRVIAPLQIVTSKIYDIRNTDDSSEASVVWQDCVARGESAPTWRYSDLAREAGAQGMLYSSRSRPDLSHLVLFDVSEGIVTLHGAIKDWALGL